MKFQDSSFNSLKVTVGTKSVTHPRTHARTHAPTHAPKAICPINFFKVGGIIMIDAYQIVLANTIPTYSVFRVILTLSKSRKID